MSDFALYRYFIFSFGFIVFRLVLILTYTAQVDFQSKEPAKILHSLPHNVYNIEVMLQNWKSSPFALTNHLILGG